MRILLIGSGGREHALAWKLSQSLRCSKLIIAPGNAGTLDLGENRAIAVTDFSAICQLCLEEKIELLLVGPEEPLVKGLVEFLRKEPALSELMIIGPGSNGAQLEGSKAFAKAFMKRHKIPTATYGEFTAENYQEGLEYLRSHSLPIVLKADGLAAGKGVLICESLEEALIGFEDMIQTSKFGEAGKKVVVEQFLKGVEISVFVLTDGKDYLLLPEAKDYKRIGEGDSGLNTGGMGAVSPVPFVDALLWKKIEDQVVKPTVKGLEKDQIPYCGFIFIGFMITEGEPYVIEYNCRLGDPETEVVIPRLQNDLVDLLEAAAKGNLKNLTVQADPRTACAVVSVSGGYPGEYKKGLPIEGLFDTTEANSMIFHMGTSFQQNEVVTSGGRVVCVTSLSNSVSTAASQSFAIQDKIQYEGKYYRRDIGYEFK